MLPEQRKQKWETMKENQTTISRTTIVVTIRVELKRPPRETGAMLKLAPFWRSHEPIWTKTKRFFFIIIKRSMDWIRFYFWYTRFRKMNNVQRKSCSFTMTCELNFSSDAIEWNLINDFFQQIEFTRQYLPVETLNEVQDPTARLDHQHTKCSVSIVQCQY